MADDGTSEPHLVPFAIAELPEYLLLGLTGEREG